LSGVFFWSLGREGEGRGKKGRGGEGRKKEGGMKIKEENNKWIWNQ